MKRSIKLLGLLFILLGCEKEELPISPHEKGTLTTVAIELKSDYRYQVFYKLSTNTEVSRNIKTIWDLAFEASDIGYHIKLNSSKAMQLYPTGKSDFSELLKQPTDGWLWDKPQGSMDSTAFGEWNDQPNEIYVLDLGYDITGKHQGYKKISIVSLVSDVYSIKYANLDGTIENTFSISKDADYNFAFFSFNNGGEVVEVEPLKTEWDLQFSQYTHIFYDDPEPSFYLVTGVLHNTYLTSAILDTIIGFNDFDFTDAQNENYNTDCNIIGYTWKKYNYELGSYSIYTENNYVLKSQNEEHYKIHFIDFYSNTGEKGTPTFEFQKL
jgi:hypothetical protein